MERFRLQRIIIAHYFSRSYNMDLVINWIYIQASPRGTGGNETRYQGPELYILMTNKTDMNMVYLSTNSKWDNISWKRVDKFVKRVRNRIYSAAKDKDYKKLRSLQKLTMSSFAVTLYCVRKVTQKSSALKKKKTPGVYPNLYLTNDDRMKLAFRIQNIKLRDWSPYRSKRQCIPKANGKLRPLGLPAIIDRVFQAIVVVALEPEWEVVFEPSSYGFRPGKSYQDAMHRIHMLLSKKDRLWIVEADIKGCYDNISHQYIMNCVKDFPRSDLIYKWLTSGVVELKSGNIEYTDSLMGTPFSNQGGVISPLLSNIALHGLEEELNIKYDALLLKNLKKGKGYVSARANPLRRTLVRYATNFIILCPTKEIAEMTLNELDPILAKRGLEISKEKSFITNTFDGFDFLGFNIRHRLKRGYKHVYYGDHTKGVCSTYYPFISTIITPSEKSLQSIRFKLSTIFRQHRGTSVHKLIKAVNPVIRGYCESKRTHSFAKGASSIDHHLLKLQMRWIRRAHPKKSTSWVVQRYFTHLITANINNKWVFRDGRTGVICYHAMWYSKKRFWPPVVSSYSPYNPDSIIQEYFKQRQGKLFASRVVDLFSQFDYMLADLQKHQCPVCDQTLYTGEGLQRHHIIPIKDGGPNNLKNLVIVHRHCYDSIHYGENFDEWKKQLLDSKVMTSFFNRQ